MTTSIQKIKTHHYLEYIALFTLIITPAFFVVGHISAYMYFSYFDIDYFKFTDTATAFSFALEHIGLVLATLVFLFSLSIVIGISLLHRIESQPSSNKSLSKYKKIKAGIFFSIIATLTIMLLITSSIPLNFKEKIISKEFVPYEVSFNQGNSTQTCVSPLGSIGQFQAFLTDNLQPILIQKNDITYIKPLFFPVPIKSFRTGKIPIKNPKYKNEMEIWLEKWRDACKSAQASNFQIFNFSTSP